MLRFTCVILLVLLAAGAAAAEDFATPQAAADAVLAALATKDAAAVKVIARAEDPDPWLVAQELLRRGEREAAAALAKAGTGQATRGLAAAVRDFPAESRAQATWAALAACLRADKAGQRDAALKALAGRPQEQEEGILAVEVLSLRGKVLGSTDARYAEAASPSFEQSATAHEAAAARAETLGWYTRASKEYYAAGLALWMIGDRSATERMAALFRRLTAVEGKLGSAVGAARGHYRVAVAMTDLSRDDEALRLLERAEPALEKGGDLEYHARSLGHRADILWSRRPGRAAFELSCRAASLLADAKGAGLPGRFQPRQAALLYDRAMRWVTCASWATRLGELELASRYETKAAKAAEHSADARLKHRIAAFQGVLGGVRLQLGGRYMQALELFAEAARKYNDLGRAREAAGVERRMAAVHITIGDFPRAIEMAESALRVQRAENAERDIGSTLLELSAVEALMGHTQTATARLDEASQIATDVKDATLELEVLVLRATHARLRGDVAQAVIHLEAAVAKAGEYEMVHMRGRAQHRLAELLVRLGLPELARKAFASAAKDFRVANANQDLVTLRTSEGFASLELRDFPKARQAFEETLKAYRAASDRRLEAVCLDALAKIAFEQRDYDRSASLAGDAHKLAVEMGFVGRAILAQASRARALVYQEQYEEAEREFASAIQAAKDYPDPETQAVLAHHMADVRYQQGKFALAIEWATKGANAAKSYGLGLAEGEDAALRGALLHNLYSIGRRAAIAVGDLEALHDFMERARASTLVAALGGADSLRSVDVPADLREDEEVARAATARLKASYRRAARRPDKRAEAGLIAKELRVAQGALQDAVTAVRRKARSQADLTYGDVTEIAKFQETLGKQDVAILYVREKSKRPGGTLYALRVRPKPEPVKKPVKSAKPVEAAIKLIDLGPASAVEAAIKALYTDPDARVNAAKVSKLADLLFKGIERKGVERLWISPGESLATVPFGLLDTERDVALMPSVTAMGMLKELEGPGGEKVLALGNPVYGKRGGYKDLPALPETELEANDAGDKGFVLLAKDASETGFYTRVKEEARWRGVHFACHGMVDMDRATRSWLALTADDENDGRLDAREVFNLSVPADLVVLSGCETGRGQVIRGDGLTGLMRAFMQAGAPRVLCSLWKVPDDSTRLLMQEFYKRWNPKKAGAQRMTVCAALRAAQKAVREHTVAGKQPFAHPEHWAAWVVWGSPN